VKRSGYMVQGVGIGFRVYGSRFRVWGLKFRGEGLWFGA